MINSRKQLLLVLTSISLLLGLSAAAQEVRFTSTEFQLETESKLQVSLQRLVDQSSSSGTARIAPAQSLTRRFDMLGDSGGTFPSLRMHDDNVQIVIETLPGTNLEQLNTWIENRGGVVEVSLTEMTQASFPVSELENLSARDDISFVRLPVRLAQNDESARAAITQGNVLSEGVGVIGSQAWNEAGLTGDGVKVGVIDQFGLYRSLMGSELPDDENAILESFASHGEVFDPDGPEEFQTHGTSVSEIIFDIAPEASHHIAYFETLAEFFEASQWLIEEQEVDVINTSLGFDSGCFRDGDGLLEPIFAQAGDAGIVWTSASGNEGNIHLLDKFEDPDNDTRHNFGTDDEGNTVEALLREIELSSGTFATAEFFAIYSWDAPCTNAADDYEMVLLREVNGVLEEVPQADNSDQLTDWLFEPGRPIKFFFGFVDFDESRVGERETFHLGFKKINPIAEDVQFTVLHYGCVCFSIEYLTPEGSVGILEPGVSPNVIGVGAAHHALDCPTTSGLFCPDGRLLFYSSQGPTKDGRLKPEIAAPTHVTTATDGRWGGHSFSDNPGFTGTSAATPHVSGAAALVIQALREQGNDDPTPQDVLDFLQTNAEDLGPTGFDNLYGAGLLTLGQPPIDLQANAPDFSAITPNAGLQDTSVDAVISGENLDTASDVTFSGEGVTATITGSTFSTLSITLDIAADAEPGQRTFEVTSATGTAQNTDVVFTVTRGPTIEVSPEAINFSATEGEANPDSRELTINNIGGGGFSWSAISNVSWISLDPGNGTLDNDTSAQTTTVSIDITDLAAGVHEGEITISSQDALNGPITIPVMLTLAEGAEPPPPPPPPPPVVEGELLAIEFDVVEFNNAESWTRELVDGCVAYTNVAEGPEGVTVTLSDGTVIEYDIPAGNQVLICGDVAHIDTRTTSDTGSEGEEDA